MPARSPLTATTGRWAMNNYHRKKQNSPTERFESLFKENSNGLYDRARAVFEKFGGHWAYKITNVLGAARRVRKMEEALVKLERYWTEELETQTPEVKEYLLTSATAPIDDYLREEIYKKIVWKHQTT